MRSVFKASAAALRGAGYDCSPFHGHPKDAPSDIIVFGGQNVVLIHQKGGSYSDNGGTHYERASLYVKPRFYNDRTTDKAVRMAAAEVPEFWNDIHRSNLPRTSEAESECLRRLEAFDQHVGRLIPDAAAYFQTKEDQRRRQETATRLKDDIRVTTSEIEAEVIRLFQEGHFDGNNVLSHLKHLSEQHVAQNMALYDVLPEEAGPKKQEIDQGSRTKITSSM